MNDEAVQFLAKVLSEYGYGTKQRKDAASIVERLQGEGWMRKRRRLRRRSEP